jgi:undecaprenyl-diphosphatase
VCFAGNLILIAGLNWAIKHVIQRPRPDESLRLATEDGYSYPSGHAMVTTAFYGLIIYFVYKNVENKIFIKNISKHVQNTEVFYIVFYINIYKIF